MDVVRREALALLGAGVAGTLGAPVIAATGRREAGDARFLHGVASGDPDANGALLWTRVSVPDGAGDVPLRWFVAREPGGRAVQTGRVVARAAADHTVKAEVGGLRPGVDHWFWFETRAGTRSPVGRFRTLPVGATAEVVLALASCQLYPGGYFTAWADLARRQRVDAVLHLGDYIYEYGLDGYGAEIGRRIGRLPDPPHETVSLADYRRRHAQVKADPAMQAAHARAAFICVWDDHEVTNDAWLGGAENHQPATEGDWRVRKAAALQAYFEWMPIRDPRRRADPAAIYRSFEFGDLATLAMLETRLFARSEQVAFKGEVPSLDDVPRMLAERMRPDRELLGPAQMAWLEAVLRGSVRAGKPWQLLGNQVVMAPVAGPDLVRGYGAERWRAIQSAMPTSLRARLETARLGFAAGLPFNLDAWDGYPPARERLYAMLRRVGARPIAFAGDSHASWVNELVAQDGTRIGSEFGTTAITSPSYGSVLPGVGRIIADQNPAVRWCDQDSKGYTLVTLTREAVTAEFVAMSTVTEPTATPRTAARWRATPGELRAV